MELEDGRMPYGYEGFHKYKKWSIMTMSSTMAILTAMAIITVVVDPFFHYHKPISWIPYILNNQSYQNPGIVRHFEYDGLITGSSMTENFRTTEFHDILGVNAIKVPYSGGSTKNMNIIIDMALENNPNLQTVFLGLDLIMLRTSSTDTTRNPLPYYIYDNNPFNDVAYLLNKDLLFYTTTLNVRNAILGKEPTSFDRYSFWEEHYTFSQYTLIGDGLAGGRVETSGLSLDEQAGIANEHLDKNILPLVERYPNVDFVIFFSPYSILYWHGSYYKNNLTTLECAIRKLIDYGNVKLFLFLNESSIVTNLYRYKDVVHFDSDVNSYMIRCFKDGTHQLTRGNYADELAKMGDLATNFDFGVFAREGNPFIGEYSLVKYIDGLNDPRYVTFIATRGEAAFSIDDIFGDRLGSFETGTGEGTHGFIAIINGGDLTYQESSDEAIIYDGMAYGCEVTMISEIREDQNHVEVVIDGVRYTTNQKGANIVVYDTVLKRVMDNIAVSVDDGRISRR